MRPLAGDGAYLLFTLGLIGTGMLGVPVLVGSCAYAVAEGAGWRGSMGDKPGRAPLFYAVMAVAMALGLVLNYVGFNAVKMLFWSAVINGLLAPPLILLVILLTSSRKIMGQRVNPPLLRYLGWATFAVMTAAAVGMIGGQLRGWRNHASAGDCHGPAGRFDPSCLRNFAGVSRDSRRDGCARGWRRS